MVVVYIDNSQEKMWACSIYKLRLPIMLEQLKNNAIAVADPASLF